MPFELTPSDWTNKAILLLACLLLLFVFAIGFRKLVSKVILAVAAVSTRSIEKALKPQFKEIGRQQDSAETNARLNYLGSLVERIQSDYQQKIEDSAQEFLALVDRKLDDHKNQLEAVLERRLGESVQRLLNDIAISGKSLQSAEVQSTKPSCPPQSGSRSEMALAHTPLAVKEDSHKLANMRYFEYYNHAKKIDISEDWNRSFVDVANGIVDSGTTFLLHDRLYLLWQAVRSVARSRADIIEIGVWRGGSTRFLAEAQRHFLKEGRIFACDTFAGFPHVVSEIDGQRRDKLRDRYKPVDFEMLTQQLSAYDEIELVRGDILETGPHLASSSVALLHIDVDVYRPTKLSLELLAPRLVEGGAIIIDDYGFTTCPGVKTAVDEFITAGMDFQLFHLPTGQALLVRSSAGATQVQSRVP